MYCGGVGDRADLRVGAHRVAHLRGLRERDELLDELVVDRVAAPAAASRRCTSARSPRRCRRSTPLTALSSSRVVEHDVRRLAAELHADALQSRAPRLRRSRCPVASEPVNATFATSGCSTSGAPTSAPKPVTTLTTPGGKPGLLDQLHELERRGRREFRRLDDDRVAGGERGRQLPRGQQQRRVPRHDRRDDAERLVARVVERVGLVGRQHRAFDLVGEAAEVVVPLRHVRGLRAHLGDELAVVAHLDLGELPRVRRDQVAELAQQRAALRSRSASASRLSVNALCAARTARSTSAGVAARDQRPRLAGVRVVRLEGLRRTRRRPTRRR